MTPIIADAIIDEGGDKNLRLHPNYIHPSLLLFLNPVFHHSV